jgi:hypothetical protein
VGQVWRWWRSFFRAARKDSATALSQHTPVRPRLVRTWWALQRATYCAEVDWHRLLAGDSGTAAAARLDGSETEFVHQVGDQPDTAHVPVTVQLHRDACSRLPLDPQIPRHITDRSRRLDHHLRRLSLELRTEPATPLGHEQSSQPRAPVQQPWYTPRSPYGPRAPRSHGTALPPAPGPPPGASSPANAGLLRAGTRVRLLRPAPFDDPAASASASAHATPAT